MSDIQISLGLKPEHREKAAELYYAAFRQKFQPIFRDEVRAQQVLQAAFDENYVIVATYDGDIVGLAGFQEKEGNLLDVQPKHMTQVFGWLGGWIRIIAFSIFSRSAPAHILLMDGIVVDASMRGKGIGSRLLEEIVDLAREKGYEQVQLDVVDTNPRARQLYERKGFVATKTESYPFFQRIFGFGGSTTMLKAV